MLLRLDLRERCAKDETGQGRARGDDPRFATNSDRVANRQALTELLDGALATVTMTQAELTLDRLGIANALCARSPSSRHIRSSPRAVAG